MSNSGTVTLDTTLPVATITAPSTSQTLSNVYQNGASDVSVVGTVSDLNLSNWTVDWSTAGSPSVWTTVGTGTGPVSNAQILLWSTLALTNGNYNLRLRAWDKAGNLSTTTLTPSIANFQASQNAYQMNASANQTVTYTSVVPFTVTETLSIKNATGSVVRTLLNAQRAAGSYADAWNGRNDASTLVPDGPYSYTVNVTDGTHSMVWDTSNTMRVTNPAASSLEPTPPTTFDPFNNHPYPFSYTLDDAYRVTVEVGPAGYSYGTDCTYILQTFGTHCVNPWHYEATGTHSVSWWGTDVDGSFFSTVVGLTVVFRRDNFPTNVAVVYGTAPTISSASVTPAMFNPAAGSPAVNSPTAGTQTVTFSLATYQSQPATVTMRAVNQSNVSTLRTITLPNQSPGTVSLVWDGRSDDGTWVAEGYYTLIVTVADAIGNATTQHLVTTIRY